MSQIRLRQADDTFREILMIKGDTGEKGNPGNASESINDSLLDKLHTWSSEKINSVISTILAENEEFAVTKTFITTISNIWTGSTAPYTQTINVSGILGRDNPIVDVVLDSNIATALVQEKAWGSISKIITGDGGITITCNKKKPTTEIPIQLKVVR